MKHLFSFLCALCALLLCPSCSKDDEAPKVKINYAEVMHGKWNTDSRNTSAFGYSGDLYLYSDGGLGSFGNLWLSPIEVIEPPFSGTYSVVGNQIRMSFVFENYAPERPLEYVVTNTPSNYLYDLTHSLDELEWSTEPLQCYTGKQYFKYEGEFEEYWNANDLLGEWVSQDYTIVFERDWHYTFRSNTATEGISGCYLHVASPTDKYILLSRGTEDYGLPCSFVRCYLNWRNAEKTKVNLGGKEFTKK